VEEENKEEIEDNVEEEATVLDDGMVHSMIVVTPSVKDTADHRDSDQGA